MARTVTEIRDDIEREVAKRANVYQRQQTADWGADVDNLRDERAGIEANLRYLWEELREARVEPIRRARLTGDEALAISRGVKRMALA